MVRSVPNSDRNSLSSQRLIFANRCCRLTRSFAPVPSGNAVPDDLLAHVAPLGWEHISLAGDYVSTAPDLTVPFRPFAAQRVCVDGPLDARASMRILTGGSIASMCPAC